MSPAIPVTLDCGKIFTPQQVYDYNPNVVADTTYAPATGSPAAGAVADQGRACGWLDETSEVNLQISVARPATADLARLRSAAAAASDPQPIGSATGYFSLTSGVGQLQLFNGRYWIVISSADIGEVSDADPIAQAVVGNLSSS